MAFVLLPTMCFAQKWENLAQTPQMGWSSWNKFQGNINEDIIKGIAMQMALYNPTLSIFLVG